MALSKKGRNKILCPYWLCSENDKDTAQNGPGLKNGHNAPGNADYHHKDADDQCSVEMQVEQ